MSKKDYPENMLPNVNYRNLEKDELFDKITCLEYETMNNLYDFVKALKDIFLQEKLIQVPELMVAHLCSYLGFLTVASLGIKQASTLQIGITKLLEDQAKSAYDTFCKYPVSSGLSKAEKTKILDQLRNNSPGSLAVQTLKLGSFIWDCLQELSSNRDLYLGFKKEKQNELFCSQNIFILLLKETASRTIREPNNDVPITYIINQMTVQLGWLIGYYGYLDRKFPVTYLEYGKPCIELYIDFGHKFLELMELSRKGIKND